MAGKLLGDVEVESLLIPDIMELMAAIFAVSNEQNDFVRFLTEIVSDLYDPMAPDNEEDEDEQKDEETLGDDNTNTRSPKLTEEELDAATRRFEFLEEQLETLEYESLEYLEASSRSSRRCSRTPRFSRGCGASRSSRSCSS
ncbi:hypothetical protein PINS_up015696 [Pythium insidiosum]|nr:hypothetical protein PINS_up015696 [Pythium insidiosum]